MQGRDSIAAIPPRGRSVGGGAARGAGVVRRVAGRGTLLGYFDRLAIINLPERTDRIAALRRELARVGIGLDNPKTTIPHAPRPSDANGFPSRGVYGSFLSHLEIIEAAERDGLESVWVLEDDAIFSRRFEQAQGQVARLLSEHPWDLCYVGHSLSRGLPRSPTGLLRYNGPFTWAHCYAVHRRAMRPLIDYLRLAIDRPVGHPEGGKLYIDGAYSHFRMQNPQIVSLVASPCLSVQKGSPSSLNDGPWYDRAAALRSLATAARAARDELWRRGMLHIGPKGEMGDETPDPARFPATPWPA